MGSNEGGASTSGIASQTASGVLSGSGVLNARPGSATSSGLLSHMVSPWNADVAREYLEKVADLLLEFAGADSTVKSYMCSQSLLSRLFQMFNKIEPPILLKVWNFFIIKFLWLSIVDTWLYYCLFASWIAVAKMHQSFVNWSTLLGASTKSWRHQASYSEPWP